MKVKNFLFHRVSNERDKLWPPMPPKLFEEIIRYLNRKSRIVLLEEFLEHPEAYNRDKQLITISFDDGYKDNIEYAAPILKKYNCPASFYVVTDCIDRNLPTWTYIVDYIFQHTQNPCIELDLDFVPETFKKIDLTKDITSKVKAVKPWMKSLTNSNRLIVLQLIEEQTKTCVNIPRNQMMNWNEVRQLRGSLFTVGSHTHTHPMLANLENNHEIKDELRISYKKLVDNLNLAPQIISYPIGSYNQRVEQIAKDCGYQWGLAVDQRFYNVAIDSPMAIPRVELYAEPNWKVYTRINGIYNGIKRLVK